MGVLMGKIEAKGSKEENENDQLFYSLRGFLAFGKVLGVIPYSGVLFGSSSEQLKFNKKSITACITYMIICITSFNFIVSCIEAGRLSKTNAFHIAMSIRATAYITWGCGIYISFIVRAKEFLQIFKAWSSIQVKYTRKDVTLKRDVAWITTIMMTSCILENAVLHLQYIKELDFLTGYKYDEWNKDMTFLETYYSRSHVHWWKMFPYNWFLAVLVFIQQKWVLYAWNYMDILITILARAIYFRFRVLYEIGLDNILRCQGFLNQREDTVIFIHQVQVWKQIVCDHQNLCRLLSILENFLAPFIFGAYAINLFYVCLQLLDCLTLKVSPGSFVNSIYVTWSFLHLIMKIVIMSISCARVNVYVHKIRDLFHECPMQFYGIEVSRLDKRLTSGPQMGLSGWGCFVITKPFLLTVFNVIITFEIILLQCWSQN